MSFWKLFKRPINIKNSLTVFWVCDLRLFGLKFSNWWHHRVCFIKMVQITFIHIEICTQAGQIHFLLWFFDDVPRIKIPLFYTKNKEEIQPPTVRKKECWKKRTWHCYCYYTLFSTMWVFSYLLSSTSRASPFYS